MAIKAIIFDCFGVLIMGGRQSLALDFPEQQQALHDLSVRSDYGFIERDEYAQELIKLTGVTPEEFRRKYWSKNVHNEPMFEWVRALKKEGQYKIGLLSNIGIKWLDEFLPEEERRELFDDVVLSYQVGMIKPDQKIFELTAERLGVEPNECVMIDDLLENVEAATAVGMNAIVYDTTTQTKLELERIIDENHA
jgi:epoxide hydrolase-like predicted phosphatase